MTSLKNRILANGHALGSWINSASPVIAELMAASGFDFLTVDIEHAAIDLAAAQCLFQAIRSGNPACASLARLAGHSYSDTKRFMDAGADGVIAPMISSAQQAEEIVQAVKFPPQGRRGVGFCRANGYGLDLPGFLKKSNEESFVCIQIEHVDALAKLDGIFAVPGIDAVLVGPYDLSASMGLAGRFDHPDMVKATTLVLDRARAHGIVPGIHVIQPDIHEVLRRHQEGYRFIAFSLDITMLTSRCSQDVKAINAQLAGK
jgi:2-dehydro-3-deoxyglucarate aldolase